MFPSSAGVYLSRGSVSDPFPPVLARQSAYQGSHALTVEFPLVIHVHHVDFQYLPRCCTFHAKVKPWSENGNKQRIKQRWSVSLFSTENHVLPIAILVLCPTTVWLCPHIKLIFWAKVGSGGTTATGSGVSRRAGVVLHLLYSCQVPWVKLGAEHDCTKAGFHGFWTFLVEVPARGLKTAD